MLNLRSAQTDLEEALRDTILYALGRRLDAVASVAALRAIPTTGVSGPKHHNDVLVPIVVSSAVTASYRWSQESTATDNSTSVIKPNDVSSSSTGRWILWTSPIRYVPVVGGDSYYLHELETGIVERVLVLDSSMTRDQIQSLIFGQVPSILIEATGDKPSESDFNTGYRWLTDYDFTISVVAQNLRDRREHAQGSTLDDTVGANTIDASIQSLLSGIGLYEEIDGVRNIRAGAGRNFESEEGQRRVIRQRDYTVQATIENPAAPNDVTDIDRVDYQAHMAGLGDPTIAAGDALDPSARYEYDSFDDQNYISSGMGVAVGVGLSKSIAAGTVVVDGATITYAGQLKTFTANKWTYRDLLPNGSLAFVESDPNAEEPDVTATATRIGMTITDGSSVLSDRFIAMSRVPYGSIIQQDLTD
jgi:hypothetical protein